MDDADRAARYQAEEIERGVRNVRSTSLPYTGRCAWCDAPVPYRNRFCDVDCRDDWEKYWRRQR